MSASTTSIIAQRRNGLKFEYPVAAAVVTLIGTLAALDGSHNLVRASDASARRVVGLFAQEVDNASGAAGDQVADVEAGCFKLNNSGTNAVTSAHIGLACFVEDNQTVASSAGTNSVVAGIVAKVESDGVWVHTGPHLTRVPVQVTLASTNGTFGAAADLAAAKAEGEKVGDDLRAIHAALCAHGILKP